MPFARPSVDAACPQPARRRRPALALAAAALATAGTIGGFAGTATAAPASVNRTAAPASTQTTQSTHHSTYARKSAEWHAEARRVLEWARKQAGKPYSYGAAGPNAFDCSGLVMYVFQHAIHRSLPHNAAQQYYSIRHIRHRDLKPGDLIFVDDGGISHVGIFAGHHHWWVAPHTGSRVYRQRIYRAHMVYGRAIPWPKS